MSNPIQIDLPSPFEVTGRALLVCDHRILLVSHGNYWYTPGGRAEPGESLPACVKREVLEETGLEVDVGPLVHVAEYLEEARGRHKIECYFLVTATSKELPETWQDHDGTVTHRRFFTLDELDDNLDVQPRFLRLGTWLKENDDSEIYRGFERR